MTIGGDGIVIIGQSGQVSRSLEEVLMAAGHRVVKIGRPEVDLCDERSLSRAILAARPRIVVNAAAYTAVDRAEDDPETAHAVNAEGARAAAQAAAEAGAPIIHVSTDYVFDGKKKTPYAETDPVSPIGVYGQSKRAGETLVAAANPNHVILRTSWVFSPFGSNFAKTMLRLNQERSEIGVVSDQHGSPTYASDLAVVVRQIIDKLSAPLQTREYFGTFHAVNAGETTWHAFAEAIIEGAALRGAPRAAVLPIATKDYPTRALRPAYSVLSTTKLHQIYSIRLRPWPDALSDALDRLIGPLNRDATLHLQQDFGKSA
ncbi:dTDP-4-dehydrorhamnose reductase [Hyphomicrobium sp.]|uniref:dTDP-4-dehydrorhamnose reductase n=1 Tax=Hyphomicrobium sp. TaxID=82 RepID=UPI003569D623